MLACARCFGATPAPFSGESIAVHDGDSFVVRTADGRRLQVRIAGIDAPEKGQPFADVSRRQLAALLRDRTLGVFPVKTDPYGRTVADVTVEGADVGLAQVRLGLAWHFRRYASEQSPAMRREYAAAESQAREHRIGLWADPHPIEPWKHRDALRGARSRQPTIAGSSSTALP